MKGDLTDDECCCLSGTNDSSSVTGVGDLLSRARNPCAKSEGKKERHAKAAFDMNASGSGNHHGSATSDLDLSVQKHGDFSSS